MIVIRVSEISTSFDPSGVCADFLIVGCQGASGDGDPDYALSDGQLSDDARHDDDDVGGALVFYLQEADWRKPIPAEVASASPANINKDGNTMSTSCASLIPG